MQKEYRILPVQVPVHGLKSRGFLDTLGYELFFRREIRLVSLGVYDSEEAAEEAAKRHASPNTPKFV